KTIKATLLLVPLLGVSNLLLFFEPSRKDEKATQAYMVSTTVLQHSQCKPSFLEVVVNYDVRIF
uniref:Uncharacterized protein n=1 Tax=Romanomermis culicivorax TaxID=13658 RepID=A0A915INK6_ROMCU